MTGYISLSAKTLLLHCITWICKTRMHSSRMRTGCSLTVCWSLLRVGGGVSSRGGVSAPGGLVWGECLLLGGSAPGGVWSGGCLLSGGVWSGGCLVGGDGACSGWGGVWSGGYIPVCTEADTPPPSVDRHTPVKILPWPNFVAAGNNISSERDSLT